MPLETKPDTKRADSGDSSPTICSESDLVVNYGSKILVASHHYILTAEIIAEILNEFQSEIRDKFAQDKSRLDWLEKSKGRCGYSETTYIGEGFFAHPLAMGDKYDAGKTIPEAIDKAISNY